MVDYNNIENSNSKLVYVRRLYDLILKWYNNADTKAQAILTLDGAIITIITGFIFLKPLELKKIVCELGPLNYIFLLLMALSLIVSVVCALNSFRSRLNKNDIMDAPIDNEDIPPEKMWFFGDIATSKKALFKQMVNVIDEEFELTALAEQIHILSANVLHKHQWVNRAFLAFGISLIAFILFATSYIVNLANT